MWKHTGKKRPDFAIEPGPGQESVWDYPRPPSMDEVAASIEIRHEGERLAAAERALVLRETASPPTWYIAADAVETSHLIPAEGSSFCEWKGTAEYFALPADPATPVAWCYPQASPPYEALSGWLCFYPGRVDCFIDGERVRAQAGGFYGGWITDAIVGPWKGEAGTGAW